MTKEKAIELLIKAIPYPHHITDWDISSEDDAIRFNWRGNKLKLSFKTIIMVEKCDKGTLLSDDFTLLLETLLQYVKVAKNIDPL